MDRNCISGIFFLLSLICLLFLQIPLVIAEDSKVSSFGEPEDHVIGVVDSWGRDPFAMDSKKGVEAVGGEEPVVAEPVLVRLNGIMEVDGSFVALINGRQVTAGETVDGVLIRKIHRRGIVIEDENGSREIFILEAREGLKIISRMK